ncbi:RNA-directed DNA polymerase homolog [Solanum tuberosum]|uniref:RNA-directed DNA polymerase homolog n=1 Tax=Solanum tuberosum TaxID=4113 RepID=UPI000739F93C|nr:PREDICTED: RNA-directed DNA polymerase homolog [Solanum tuberosum]
MGKSRTICTKKGGITVVPNEKGELVPMRLVTDWRISIALKDQEKTTFTCTYGTLAFKRMPFGLCNAPATFQRCMFSIFAVMVEDSMEIFMDDFSVVGDSFEACIEHLGKVLQRAYLLGTTVVVHMDHAAIIYLMAKKDANQD